MTKDLRKAIMKRSQLTTIYFKTNTAESLRSYMNQEYFCSKFYKKEWKEYYHILKLNKVTDNKRFAKTVKPFLSDTGTYINKITLIRRVTRGGEGREVSPALFQKLKKIALILEKNALIVSILG